MKQILLAIFIVVCFCSLASARLTRVYIIVNTDNAPVEILEFGKYVAEKEDYISSVVKYWNRTDRDIEALAITMVYFDAFNEVLDGLSGVSTETLKPNQQDGGGWSTYGKRSFVKTAMAYVSAVRFMNGEVWKADSDDVFEIAKTIPELAFLSEAKMLEIEKE